MPKNIIEGNFYYLQQMTGQSILDIRERKFNNDRYNKIRLYETEIDPNKSYMVSIIDEDITMLSSIYIEEIIYEIN